MCNFDYSIIGHGWERQFYFCENRQHKSFNGFGGARFLFEIFEDSDIKISPLELYGNIAKEHLEIEKDKLEKYVIKSNMGWTKGNSIYKYNDANAAIVWDEGNEGFISINNIPSDVPILWVSNKCLPNPKVYPKIKSNCFLMLDVKVLRKNGIHISSNISWEQTATELNWQLKFNSKLTYLKDTADILIMFGEDAAIYLQSRNEISSAKLILAHSESEGWFKDKNNFNEMTLPDTWTIMVAHVIVEWKKMRTDKDYKLCVENVLKSAEILIKSGYNSSTLEECKYKKWSNQKLEGLMGVFNIPQIKADQDEPDLNYWRIIQSFDNVTMYDLANDYVKEGEKAINGIPFFKCGGLITIDRKEIEAYQSIKKLIENYFKSNNTNPLNIAVFGAPGSGKSFGVTQIAENILKEVSDEHGVKKSVISKLVFNISQITKQEDLIVAFHKVRDTVLNGKLPLVFFDEFDSDKDGIKLGWLKSFLMPMNDGKFTDVSGEHPIGKSIFIFAGGTCCTYNEFRYGNCESQRIEYEKDFISKKGIDFASRLKGTIDIKGPNKSNDKNVDDKSYILRRALLLKSLLDTREIKDIDVALRRTLLLLPEYYYGGRSMEAILDMCDMKGDTQLRSEHLPSFDQLSLHVNADIMKKILERDILFNLCIEYMAELTHKIYIEYARTLPILSKKKQSLIYWESLDENKKESNREQVRSIPDHLEMIQCSYEILETKYNFIEYFDDKQIGILAKAEHDRWVKERKAEGYEYGAIRDDDNKIHPCMVEWSELSPEEQQKDIEIVKNIIPMFKKAKFGIYKIE